MKYTIKSCDRECFIDLGTHLTNLVLKKEITIKEHRDVIKCIKEKLKVKAFE